MKKKLSFVLAFILIVSTFLSACGNAPPVPKEGEAGNTSTNAGAEESPGATQEQMLVWNIGSETGTWDPQLASTSQGIHICYNLWEGLYRDTKDGLENGMAERHEVSANSEGVEDTVYTFYLRDGLKWSDGSPLTAQQFVDSWLRALDPKSAAPYSFLLADYIVGANEFFAEGGKREDVALRALDEKTLQVELKNPCPYFLNLVSFVTFQPTKEATVEEGWEKKPETCISNGPFKLVEYKIGSHMIFKKNENYWDADNVKLDGIRGLMIAEANTALQGYQSGEIQVLSTIPQEEVPKLMAEDPNFVATPGVGSMFYCFNVDVKPMDDINVRKALSLAIDRKALVEQVLRGGQQPASAYVPPSFQNSDGSSFRKMDGNGKTVEEFGIDPWNVNVEKAKEYLSKAGYLNGEGFPELELFHDVNENNKKIAEAIQEMWQKNLNIKVKLRSEEWKVYVSSRWRGEFTVCRGGWGGDYFDPRTMLDLFTSYGINFCQWRWQPFADRENDKTLNPANKAYDEALIMSTKTTGAERDKYLHEAENVLMEDAVIIPLYYYVDTYIVDNAKVKNVKQTTMGGWDFKYAEMIQK